MHLRYCLLIGSLFILTGCMHHRVVPNPTPTHSATQNVQVSSFTRATVNGRFNVTLHTGASRSQLILRGDPRDLSHVQSKVVNGVLYVSAPKDTPQFGGLQVDIYTRYLNAFEYHGAGLVMGAGLRVSLLDLVIDNPGQTRLAGRIGLHSLDVKGGGYTQIAGINSPNLQLKIADNSQVKLAGRVNLTELNLKDKHSGGRLSVYWVKSRALVVRGGGKSFIQLAGVVDKLDVELWDQSHFNGRYLRAERAFIKTHDQSLADISAVKRQHTLAMDTSDIHFYNLSTLRTDYMADMGAVLDFRDHGTPFEQEYTPYNKIL